MNGSSKYSPSLLSKPDPTWLEIEKSGILDNAPSLSKTPLAELRKLQGGFGIKSNNTPTSLKTKDLTIKVSDGANIKARTYTPINAPDLLPICVVYHGGGWTIGDLETEDGIVNRSATEYSVLSISLCPWTCGGRECRLPAVCLSRFSFNTDPLKTDSHDL